MFTPAYFSSQKEQRNASGYARKWDLTFPEASPSVRRRGDDKSRSPSPAQNLRTQRRRLAATQSLPQKQQPAVREQRPIFWQLPRRQFGLSAKRISGFVSPYSKLAEIEPKKFSWNFFRKVLCLCLSAHKPNFVVKFLELLLRIREVPG